jgi:hypothetical protein
VRRAIDIHEGEEVNASAFKSARSSSSSPSTVWQVETFEESEVPRDSDPERCASYCSFVGKEAGKIGRHTNAADQKKYTANSISCE